jgi:hypothetical protein
MTAGPAPRATGLSGWRAVSTNLCRIADAQSGHPAGIDDELRRGVGRAFSDQIDLWGRWPRSVVFPAGVVFLAFTLLAGFSLLALPDPSLATIAHGLVNEDG